MAPLPFLVRTVTPAQVGRRFAACRNSTTTSRDIRFAACTKNFTARNATSSLYSPTSARIARIATPIFIAADGGQLCPVPHRERLECLGPIDQAALQQVSVAWCARCGGMPGVSQKRCCPPVPGTLNGLLLLSLRGFSENRDDWRERTESRGIKFFLDALQDLPFF
jgi:hypothetical protein